MSVYRQDVRLSLTRSGDKNLKQKYEGEVSATDTHDYWHIHDWNIQVIAARAVARHSADWAPKGTKRKRKNQDDEPAAKRMKSESEDSKSQELSLRALPAKPYNPYEGSSAALQLHESVDDFLSRLKPSCVDTDQPWIWCANFQAEHRPANENIAVFKQIGSRLLEQFAAKRHKLETSSDPPKSVGTITRMMGLDRKNLEEDIMRAAKSNGIICGKWMLFPSEDKVDRYWAEVVRGTVEDRLGIAAKVATRPDKPGGESTRVICVYTRDINNEADIKRVLEELVRLKLALAIPGPLLRGAGVNGQIWYKPDCYTYLELMSGNEYKIKPTLYGTSSLLRACDVQGSGVNVGKKNR